VSYVGRVNYVVSLVSLTSLLDRRSEDLGEETPSLQKLGMLADRIIVTTGGDHTSVEDIVGLIHTYRRDMECSNNSVMDTIIICPD